MTTELAGPDMKPPGTDRRLPPVRIFRYSLGVKPQERRTDDATRGWLTHRFGALALSRHDNGVQLGIDSMRLIKN